jgi:tetratricopeptide (TPR) repeat protein
MNAKFEFGWNCHYKSRWDFILNHRGRLTTRRFMSERKLFNRLPYAMKHTLFHPDDLKKLRDKPFSGLFFNFDKYKEEANKHYKEGEYFEAIDLYEQILSVFKWVEFEDKEKNEDFFKAMKLDPLLDKDIKVTEKDLEDDECEIEMRTNLVVTLLMSIGYSFMKMFYFDEAYKCFSYAIELAPIASDAYLRRSQAIMYNKESTIDELKLAVEDVNKAIEKRPKDKFYQQHKTELNAVIQATLTKKITFIKELVERAHYSIELKEKVRERKR